MLISYTEHFIYQHDICFQAGSDGKGKFGVHAAGISFDGHVDESAKFGKLNDCFFFFPDLVSAVPFDIQRVFYIYESDSTVVRGQHANRESEFVLINVSGQSKVRITDGKEECIVALDKPMMGVYIPKMMWKDMYDFRLTRYFWYLLVLTIMERNIFVIMMII